MTRTNEPSTYERPEWPLNAIPKRWIEALFAKMSSFYGSKFAAMWSGSKPEEVQKAWAIELAKLTREQLKAGSDALTAFAKPPTLPEFIAHCRQMRSELTASTAVRIEHRQPVDPAKAEAAMREVRVASKKVMHRTPTAEWAYRLLMSGRKDLPYEVSRCATDAITSSAGRRPIENCPTPEIKAEYETIRQATIDGYRMRGIPLWDVK